MFYEEITKFFFQYITQNTQPHIFNIPYNTPLFNKHDKMQNASTTFIQTMFNHLQFASYYAIRINNTTLNKFTKL